jgi:hypothetical protein
MEALRNLSFLIMEFRLSRSLSQTFLLHDEILAIMEPFTNFSFMRWNFGYHGAFHKLFCFTRWNFGYHEAFHELFFHTIEFRLSRSLSRIFLMAELTSHMIWEKTLFIYITKSIYIGSASL